MDEGATLVQEHSHSSIPRKLTNDFKPSCPFCVIASTYGPVSPLSAPRSQLLESTQLDPPSFVLFSTEHVIAFLDIMPLTRGHVLVAPRKHRVKVGDLNANESAEIGRVLPLIARSVLKSVLPDIPHEEADYNIVQNNGPGAAQVVPHVHFHIIPRPPLNYRYQPTFKAPPKHSEYPPNQQPSARQRNAVIFGRGTREDLDYDESEVLVEDMRRAIKEEWETTLGLETLSLGSDKEVLEASGDAKSRKGAWKV